jgi:hypothetical protein
MPFMLEPFMLEPFMLEPFRFGLFRFVLACSSVEVSSETTHAYTKVDRATVHTVTMRDVQLFIDLYSGFHTRY